MKDPYGVLGVSKTAAQDEIRNAYRKLAKKYHPDLNPGNKAAEARFKEIQEAYDKIGEPEKRAKFDRGETEEQQQGPFRGRRGPYYYETQTGPGSRYAGSFSFEDLFGGGGASEGFDEDLLRDLFGRARAGTRRSSGARRGEDELYHMEVSFRDAVLGAERQITLPSGKRLEVKIPPGVDTGTRLRFAGQAMPPPGGGPAGDVYVELLVQPSSRFKRSGKDLELELPISLAEALFGGEVRVPTLDGQVMLRIPPGVSSGTKLRVRGKGVPAPGGGERGDLMVSLQVKMPSRIDPELSQAIRRWSEKHPEDPRGEEFYDVRT